MWFGSAQHPEDAVAAFGNWAARPGLELSLLGYRASDAGSEIRQCVLDTHGVRVRRGADTKGLLYVQLPSG